MTVTVASQPSAHQLRGKRTCYDMRSDIPVTRGKVTEKVVGIPQEMTGRNTENQERTPDNEVFSLFSPLVRNWLEKRG